MLSAGPNTFLSVESTLQFGHVGMWINIAQKDGFVLIERSGKDISFYKIESYLVHPSIRKEQSGIIIRYGRGDSILE